MSKNLVSVNDCDYLEEDPELRGQKYCCLSFLSPEKILENKEVFRFNKFTTFNGLCTSRCRAHRRYNH